MTPPPRHRFLHLHLRSRQHSCHPSRLLPPQVRVEVPVEVIKEVIREVPVERIVERIVEKIVEVPQSVAATPTMPMLTMLPSRPHLLCRCFLWRYSCLL